MIQKNQLRSLSLLAATLAATFFIVACAKPVTVEKNNTNDQEAAIENQESMDSEGVKGDETSDMMTDTPAVIVPNKPVEDVTDTPVVEKPVGPEIAGVVLINYDQSGQSGSAEVKDIGENRTRVSIQLDNASTGAIQPAYIRTGTCGSGGPAKHILNNVNNGSSESIVSSSYSQLKMDAPLVITVHKSPNENNLVACGSIEF